MIKQSVECCRAIKNHRYEMFVLFLIWERAQAILLSLKEWGTKYGVILLQPMQKFPQIKAGQKKPKCQPWLFWHGAGDSLKT